MAKARNLLFFTYDEEDFNAICEEIYDNFSPILELLDDFLQQKLILVTTPSASIFSV